MTKTYKQALELLTSQGKFYINLGLERISAILDLMGNPQKKLKCIHVAGTNGKGSVCAIISTILTEAGYKTGLFTSPHIFKYTERIQIDGNKIPEDVFVDKIFKIQELSEKNDIHLTEFELLTAVMFEYFAENKVDFAVLEVGLGGTYDSTNVIENPLCSIITTIDLDHTERLGDTIKKIAEDIFADKIFKIQELSEKNDIHLTEFELLTAVMFEYFAENKVDFAVLEVGLGGTYDSTNVIESPICSIITTIDLDHTERLGDTIKKIAEEKAGIIKPDCPVVINATNKGFDVIKSHTVDDQLCIARDFSIGEMSLKGFHQQENLALAISATLLVVPDIKLTTIQNAIKHVVHHGRFEYFADRKILIDGAHNPNGVDILRQNIDIYFKDYKHRFVFGCLKNKDYKQMVDILFKEGDEIYFNHFNHSNSTTFEELSSVCKYPSKEFNGTLPEFDGITIICGSLYMLSEVMNDLDIQI